MTKLDDTYRFSMRDARLRFGIVGCGAVVENYHLPALITRERIALEAVVDSSVERARAVAEKPGARALTDYRELVGMVDAALVAVPNDLHAAVTSDLLRAGVHVLVEKPLAPTVRECDLILAAEADSGSVLAVGLDFRFAPAIRLVKEMLDAEVLGSVRELDLRHGTDNRWPLQSGYLFDRDRAGGGVLLDHGAHLLDHVLWWLGRCAVDSYRDDGRGGLEADAEVRLTARSGGHCVVELSRTRALRNTCRIECDRGVLEVGLFEPCARVVLQLAGDVPVLAGDVGDPDLARRPYTALFERQLDDFAEAIVTPRQPFVPGREGRHAIELIEECYAVRQPLEHAWDYPQVYEAVR